MVNARLNSADDSPEDSASDRTPVLIDAEAPRRLGDDAPEPRPSTAVAEAVGYIARNSELHCGERRASKDEGMT
jgi:hypothetical protein